MICLKAASKVHFTRLNRPSAVRLQVKNHQHSFGRKYETGNFILLLAY